MTVPAVIASLPLVCGFLTAAGSELQIPERDLYHLQLAAEEACANIIEHGCPPSAAPFSGITLDLVSTQAGWTLIIRDKGILFDPTCLPSPDISCDISSRRAGGLGVYLMRKMVDDVSYSSAAGENRLSLTIRRR